MANVARFTEIVSLNERVNRQVKGTTTEIYGMVAEIKNVEKTSGGIAAIAEESSAGSEEIKAAVEGKPPKCRRFWHQPPFYPVWLLIWIIL